MLQNNISQLKQTNMVWELINRINEGVNTIKRYVTGFVGKWILAEIYLVRKGSLHIEAPAI